MKNAFEPESEPSGGGCLSCLAVAAEPGDVSRIGRLKRTIIYSEEGRAAQQRMSVAFASCGHPSQVEPGGSGVVGILNQLFQNRKTVAIPRIPILKQLAKLFDEVSM